MPFCLLPFLLRATMLMKGALHMDTNRSIDSGNWHYQFVDGVLYITAKDQSGHQVALTSGEAYDLLEYLFQYKDELYRRVNEDCSQRTDPRV